MTLEDVARARLRLFAGRLPLFRVMVAVVFGLLALRLYYLQIARGPHYRRLAEENRVSLIRVRAPRGIIRDRYGNVLVANRPSFSVSLDLGAARDREGTLDFLAARLGLDRADLARRVRDVDPYRRFEPVRIKEDVTREEVAALEAERFEHPGVRVEVEPRRGYPFAALAAHVLGYVGQISPAELKARADLGYRPGDHIGKTGIERELDAELKGRDGYQQVEVDSLGRAVKVLSGIEPVPGHDVFLTLDLGLQQAAEEALGERSGAVVVIDPRDGGVLAAASSPSFDPNRFSRGFTQEEWNAINHDPRHPLQNRLHQAQYPPGSVFKIVTALAALDRGAADESTGVFCRGGLQFGNREFRCWKRGGHGAVALHRALVESCDVYFYQIGLRLGIDGIAEYARRFGLGRPTGLDLAGEAGGLVPSTAWKRQARGEPWYQGETLSAAIGQGYDLVTPVQMAQLAATVANGGTVYRPHLLRRVVDVSGSAVREEKVTVEGRLEVAPGALRAVRSALLGVVQEPGGTGAAARVAGLEVAGKTGTAQVARMPAGERRAPGGRNLGDHAWFVCYAPAGAGQAAVASIVEHGGHGGSASAPIARRLLTELRNLGYFQVAAAAEPAAAGDDGEGDD